MIFYYIIDSAENDSAEKIILKFFINFFKINYYKYL